MPWPAGASSRIAMMSTVGPAGVLPPAEPLDPPAADVDALLELAVEPPELLHAADNSDSTAAAITTKNHERRFVPIDSPGVGLARYSDTAIQASPDAAPMKFQAVANGSWHAGEGGAALPLGGTARRA